MKLLKLLLKPPVCYMSPQLIVPPCRNYWCSSTNKNCVRPVLVVKGTLGIQNQSKFYNLLVILLSLWTESSIQTTGLLRRKVACLWIYISSSVLANFPYKLLWAIMDTLWTVAITQIQSIVVRKHFTVTIIKLLNVISWILIIHLLPIYFCANSSWNVRTAICAEGSLSSLALSSVYSPTVEDGSWWTPMVPMWDDIFTPL